MTGRKLDPIWQHFKSYNSADQKSKRAKCNYCQEEIVALVARMRKHTSKCSKRQITPTPTQATEVDFVASIASQSTSTINTIIEDETESLAQMPSFENTVGTETSFSMTSSGSSKMLESFITRTPPLQTKKLDLQVARFIYATNSSFKVVEHPEFIKMVEKLRPGYKPPNRRNIANELMDEVYESVCTLREKNLRNKNVCMSMDGWSNVHNDPVICISITDVFTEEGAVVHLMNTINTEDKSHTANYLLELAIEAIKTCQKFGCNVRSFVTDNASNMTKMRQQLGEVEEIGMPDIITYGCSAHVLNLLAKDFDNFPGLKDNVKSIIKYFKNHHFPAAKYKATGGTSLILPQDVRWNTLADCLDSYLKNWHLLFKVCSENRTAIDPEISAKIHDINLKQNCENYLFKLKKIAIALDKVQKNDCTISEATEVWIILKSELEDDCNLEEVRHLEGRFDMALSAVHFLSNLLDHRFMGQQLTEEQRTKALQYVDSYHPNCMPDVLHYEAKMPPFNAYLFSQQTKEKVKPAAWWATFKGRINEETISLTNQLHTAIASSAGIERIFSTFGMVHSKIRNRLGVEKASKLVNIFKALN